MADRPVPARDRRGRRAAPDVATSWERVATWYDGWVGDRGSRYHQGLAIPAALELLDPRPDEEILDVGAGQGVLAPYIAQLEARYTGVDASGRLIDAARGRHGALGRFLVGDARRLASVPGLRPSGYDGVVFLLSIQDIDPLGPVFASVRWALRPNGRVVILMTHPCFRQPRHSGWGWDEGRKLQFRRVDSYLSPMAVPMKSIGGGPPTRSFHRPMGTYAEGLAAIGLAIDAMREVPDLPPAMRPRGPARRAARAEGRAEARAEAEIPLFLGLRAIRR